LKKAAQKLLVFWRRDSGMPLAQIKQKSFCFAPGVPVFLQNKKCFQVGALCAATESVNQALFNKIERV
jgi:hypothetical protein